MTSPLAVAVVRYIPAALLGTSMLLLLVPATEPLVLWVLAEDRPVEDLTFVAFLGASAMAVRLARMHRHGLQSWVGGVYLLLALSFLGIALEEVSWGQRWFGVETPELLRSLNRQGEINLHNIGALQGSSEWMRLCAGLGGLLAVAADRVPRLNRLGAPPVLLPWFLIITGHAAVDAFNDIVPIGRRFDFVMQRTSEMVELLIGLAALLYGWLNVRRFSGALQNDSEGARR